MVTGFGGWVYFFAVERAEMLCVRLSEQVRFVETVVRVAGRACAEEQLTGDTVAVFVPVYYFIHSCSLYSLDFCSFHSLQYTLPGVPLFIFDKVTLQACIRHSPKPFPSGLQCTHSLHNLKTLISAPFRF